MEIQEVFPDFDWSEKQMPDQVEVNQSGFFEDPEGSWYLVRRARTEKPLDEVEPVDLYHGKKTRYINATQGAGLYFTNVVEAAENVVYAASSAKQPKQLFIAKISPEADEMLDATNSVSGKSVGQKLAALTLRTMATIPGMLYPPVSVYNRMYGEVKLVISKPSAMQRYKPGLSFRNESMCIKPRYAVVRDIGRLSIVAHRSLNLDKTH